MRFALIDNSTLTAVQRLLGDIPIRNTIVSDMDMVCLETLVQGILFYDEVVVLDDYKPEWQVQRRQAFPFLRFVSLSEQTNLKILEQAKREVENIVPRVEAGQFSDKDFAEFFKLLKMNVTFTWDMRSSEFFLNQKMLAGVGGVDLEKYSQLAESIYFELDDRAAVAVSNFEQRRVDLIASDGSAINPKGSPTSDMKGLSDQASAFFAGLNWLAFRTIYFSLAATMLQADLLLHPIRHAFHINWVSKLNGQDPSWYKPIIDAMSERAGTTLKEIVSVTQPAVAAVALPLFSAWLVRQTGDPKKVLQAALDLRSDKRLISARAAFIQLDQIAEIAPETYVNKANEVVKNLERTMAAIKADFHVGTAQGSLTATVVKAVNFGFALSPWKVPPIPPDLLKWRGLDALSERLQDRFVSPLYRSVVNDLATVARLGDLHEKLRSRVVCEPGAARYVVKTEEVKYRKVESHWKRPM